MHQATQAGYGLKRPPQLDDELPDGANRWEHLSRPDVGGFMMSETVETEAINQALQIIDRSLAVMHSRELVSTAEVTDLLLDMRSLLGARELLALADGVTVN